MNKPTVSVVIPVYNGAATVSRAIESALSQTEPPVEVIVVDDGSQDDTAAIASRFPVKFIRQANAGPAAARNHGAQISKGQWLAFLDADDAWSPHKTERQLQLTDDASIGVIHCHVRTEYRYGNPPPVVSFEQLWWRNCIAMSSALVRRLAFEECSGFDRDPAIISVEDYNLWLRMTARGWRIVTVPELLCEYTPAGRSLTRQIARIAEAELVNVKKIEYDLHISPAQAAKKRIRILEEYGRELLNDRDLRTARIYLGKALRLEPSITNLIWWLATFSPPRLLDLIRKSKSQLA